MDNSESTSETDDFRHITAKAILSPVPGSSQASVTTGKSHGYWLCDASETSETTFIQINLLIIKIVISRTGARICTYAHEGK